MNDTLEGGHSAACNNAQVGPRSSCDSPQFGGESGSGAQAVGVIEFRKAMRTVGLKPPFPTIDESLRVCKAALVYARLIGDYEWQVQLSQAKEAIKVRGSKARYTFCGCGRPKGKNAKLCRFCYRISRQMV